jgi:hypothetical protein
MSGRYDKKYGEWVKGPEQVMTVWQVVNIGEEPPVHYMAYTTKEKAQQAAKTLGDALKKQVIVMSIPVYGDDN